MECDMQDKEIGGLQRLREEHAASIVKQARWLLLAFVIGAILALVFH